MGVLLPNGLLEVFIPNDKTNLAPYRVLHFLVLAVIVHIVPRNWAGLRSSLLRPLVVCGERSLEVFCVGIFYRSSGISSLYSE